MRTLPPFLQSSIRPFIARHRRRHYQNRDDAVDKWLADDNVDALLIMQVHDDLVLEVAEADVDVVSAKWCNLMETAAELDVLLLVEAGVGNNWDEAH